MDIKTYKNLLKAIIIIALALLVVSTVMAIITTSTRCPVCNSNNVVVDTVLHSDIYPTCTVYRCKNCGALFGDKKPMKGVITEMK